MLRLLQLHKMESLVVTLVILTVLLSYWILVEACQNLHAASEVFATVPRQKTIWQEDRGLDMCSSLWPKNCEISRYSISQHKILQLVSASQRTANRSPAPFAPQHGQHSGLSQCMFILYLSRKPAGEYVIEQHALWDVFTAAWAAEGPY